MKPLNHDFDEIEKEFRIFNGVITRKNPNPNQTDIELITIQPNSYTSLRDIIAASSAAMGGAASPLTSPGSPTCRKSSRDRDDVSIRNPLVKQAALAYLQPFSSLPPGSDSRSWTERLKANLNSCFAGHGEEQDDGTGCMGPLDGVVLAPIKQVLGRFLKTFSTTERIEDHRD